MISRGVLLGVMLACAPQAAASPTMVAPPPQRTEAWIARCVEHLEHARDEAGSAGIPHMSLIGLITNPQQPSKRQSLAETDDHVYSFEVELDMSAVAQEARTVEWSQADDPTKPGQQISRRLVVAKGRMVGAALRTRAGAKRADAFTSLFRAAVDACVDEMSGNSARVEGAKLVLVNEGKELRVAHAGLRGALVASVPLRADGTDPVVWVSTVEPRKVTGLIYRFDGGEPICSVPLGDGARGTSGSATRAWILDVDGDGYNDVVVYREPLKAGSPDVVIDAVLRFEPATRRCVAATAALRDRVPTSPPWLDEWPMQLVITDKLPLPKATLVGDSLDAHLRVLRPSPIARIPGPSPPFVGVDSFSIAASGGMEHSTRADLHLVHFRHAPKLELVSSVPLGPAELPASFCNHGKFERFSREAATFTARWIGVGQRVLERRVTWSGQRLVSTSDAPTDAGSCVHP